MSPHCSDVLLETLVVTGLPGNGSADTPKDGDNGISYMYAFFHSGT